MPPQVPRVKGAAGPAGRLAAVSLLLLPLPRPASARPMEAGAPSLPIAVSADTARGRSGPTRGGEVRWFPGRTAFAPLLAAPGEVGLRGSFVYVDRGDRFYRGRNLEADVEIGHRIPVVRLQPEAPGRPELAIGFEVGVLSRFFMQVPQKDLIDSDFRVGAPFSARYGGWEGRLTLLHVSSHLGDDFIARFAPPLGEVTHDGIELLLARRVPGGLRLYAGGDLNFHVNPAVERVAGQAGLEWDPGWRSPRTGGSAAEPAVSPFGALDVQATPIAPGLAGTVAAGVTFRVAGRELRLDARGHWGPSPLGQLRTVRESFWGLGLRVRP